MAARYTTLDLCRATLRAPNDARTLSWVPGGEFDDLLLLKIEAAEAIIDLLCGRTFDAVVSEARLFTATRADAVLTDDYAAAPTAVEGVEAGVIAAANWAPMVYPKANRSGFGITLAADLLQPGERVEITADWGWTTVPMPVKEAATLYAVRLFNRADSPVGLQVGDMGAAYISRTDADVVAMLAPFCGKGKL